MHGMIASSNKIKCYKSATSKSFEIQENGAGNEFELATSTQGCALPTELFPFELINIHLEIKQSRK